MTAAVITFGFGAAGAKGGECEGAGQPDMTAFGFVATVRPIYDRDFVRKAEDGHMLEAALGERAAERAASANVKHFGQMMAKYNTLASNRLLEIAKNNNLEVTTDMDRKDQEALLHLLEIKGRDFDREYMNQVIKDHKYKVKLFEQMANEAGNPALRNYAQQTIPALREHLRMARDIYSRIES
jgi:putative membrane protein